MRLLQVFTNRMKRVGGLVIVGSLALLTVVSAFLAFQNNGNVTQLRAYELNKSLGKTHLDKFIFKDQYAGEKEKKPQQRASTYKLEALFFPVKIAETVKELHIELHLQFNPHKQSHASLEKSEVLLRDLAISYLVLQNQDQVFAEKGIPKIKRDLLLSFNDALESPIEDVLVSNIKVRNL